MDKAAKTLRKIIILAIGIPVVILGVILLPLPGPGLLIILAGLFILAQEFDWADRHIHRVKKGVQKVTTTNNRKKRK